MKEFNYVRAYDEIRFAGTASSPAKRYDGLAAVVATVSPPGSDPDDPRPAFKLWPLEDTGDPDDDKIWIYWEDIERLEVVEPGDHHPPPEERE